MLAEIGIKHLAVMGTYRDDEVDDDHALMQMRSAVAKQSHVLLCEVRLSPLKAGDVAELLSDTMQRPAHEVAELAALCTRHSQGNPFLVRELLSAWHAEGLLYLKRGTYATEHTPTWQWDIAALGHSSVSEEIAELMAKRIRRLSPATVEALAHAACGGTDCAQPSGRSRQPRIATRNRLFTIRIEAQVREGNHAGVLTTVRQGLADLGLRIPDDEEIAEEIRQLEQFAHQTWSNNETNSLGPTFAFTAAAIQRAPPGGTGLGAGAISGNHTAIESGAGILCRH